MIEKRTSELSCHKESTKDENIFSLDIASLVAKVQPVLWLTV